MSVVSCKRSPGKSKAMNQCHKTPQHIVIDYGCRVALIALGLNVEGQVKGNASLRQRLGMEGLAGGGPLWCSGPLGNTSFCIQRAIKEGA